MCVCVCGNNGNHDNDTHGTLPTSERKSLNIDGEGIRVRIYILLASLGIVYRKKKHDVSSSRERAQLHKDAAALFFLRILSGEKKNNNNKNLLRRNEARRISRFFY